MASKMLDAHLHVWASKEDAEAGKYPFAVRAFPWYVVHRSCCTCHTLKRRAQILLACRVQCLAEVTPRPSRLCLVRFGVRAALFSRGLVRARYWELHVCSDAWSKQASKLAHAMHAYAGNVEVLLSAMQEADVSGALIIQPGNHLYDHSYVTSVLRAHPDKFVGALLANPTSVRTHTWLYVLAIAQLRRIRAKLMSYECQALSALVTSTKECQPKHVCT